MIVDKPIVFGGLAMLASFPKAMLLRKPKLISTSEERLYRELLNRRMLQGLKRRRYEVATKDLTF